MTLIRKDETKISVITNNGARQKKIYINLRTLNKIFFCLIIIAGFYFITGANDLTAKGFELQSMKTRAVVIENDNQGLETKITDLNSYYNLDEKVKQLGMVSVGQITYLEAKEGIVAKK